MREASADGGAARLRVRDDGPGVPAEARHRIFEALFTTKAKGSGLGLALCRRIMEAHGGTIDLEPNDADGRELRARPAGAVHAGPGHRPRMSGSVLIVDDDDALAENLAEIVESLGVETIDRARSQERRSRMAAGHDFDVALIDVRLPDGDGLSLLGPLRARSPFVQSVLVTGNATVEGRSPPCAATRSPTSSSRSRRPICSTRSAARSIRPRSIASASGCASSWSARRQRHRELVESIPAFVLALDERGRITTWNRQLERVDRLPARRDAGHRRPRAGRAPDERPRDLPVKAGGIAQGALEPRRGDGRDGERHGLRGRHRRHRRGGDAPPPASLGAPGGRRHHGGRPGARGAQSAQLRLAAAHAARAAPGARRGRGRRVLPIARIIKSEIDRLDRLVRDFLAFAQPRPLEPRPVDVGRAARGGGRAHRARGRGGARRASRPTSRRRSPVACRRRGATAPGAAQPDPQRDRGDAATRRPRSRCARGPATDAVEIEVEDDGPGFAEDLPVFDAFFTTKEQGTGLGLPLVHRIVADHGGTIRVQSRPGRTCFTVTLPRERA